MLTVKALILKLKTLDPNAVVVVNNSEDHRLMQADDLQVFEMDVEEVDRIADAEDDEAFQKRVQASEDSGDPIAILDVRTWS